MHGVQVDTQLQDNTALGMMEVVFELYADNIVGQLGNVDMALLWILSQNTFTVFCVSLEYTISGGCPLSHALFCQFCFHAYS